MKWLAAFLTAMGAMLLGWFGMGQRARGREEERASQAEEERDEALEVAEVRGRKPRGPGALARVLKRRRNRKA